MTKTTSLPLLAALGLLAVAPPALVQSFSDSKYDPFTNRLTFVNCAGSVGFTALPAP